MRRWLALLAALLAFQVAPVHAAPVGRAFSPIIQGGGPCRGVKVGLNFVTGLYCSNGAIASSYTAIPGWTYSGGVLSGTGASGVYEVCNGVQTFFPAIAGNSTGPRVTPGCGLWVWGAATNSFLNSATGATQTVTTTAASWTLSFYGTGSVVGTGFCTISLSGSGANNRVSQTITATAGACVLTVTGSITSVQFEANPYASPYMPTTSAAVSRTADLPSVTLSPLLTSFTIVNKFASYPSGSNFVALFSLRQDANHYLINLYNIKSGANDSNQITGTTGSPAGISDNNTHVISASISSGNILWSKDGVSGTAGTGTYTTPTTSNQLLLGVERNTSLYLTGVLKSVSIRSQSVSQSTLNGLQQ